MSTLDELHERWGRNPDYREAHERLGPEFEPACALFEARTRAGMTQAELAARMKTTQSAVARPESGRVPDNLSTTATDESETGRIAVTIGSVRKRPSDTCATTAARSASPTLKNLPKSAKTHPPPQAKRGHFNFAQRGHYGFALTMASTPSVPSRYRTCRSLLIPPNVDFVGPRAHLRRVVPCLHPQQKVHAEAECLLDPERHFGRQ